MDYYIGSIIPTTFDFAPSGFLLCQGQVLNIRDYQALYAILGIRYGGDARNTFQLPDLRGLCMVGQGNVPNGPQFKVQLPMLGSVNAVAPPHTHSAIVAANPSGTVSIQASTANATSSIPSGTVIPAASVGEDNSGSGAQVDVLDYGAAANTTTIADITASGTLTSVPTLSLAQATAVGNNMQPFVAINFMIVVDGIYPVNPN